ncbi:hypothetical protein N7530_004552 [Penicillium desertorum]|uniref:Uncharacterized protein n=1 Tax=Penicillium desertorum TaxID=1303715 RepID=A0A9W9WYE7_9EURO|nr:hypothetical protein N7530_004552 [Penicillium desertorum]
MGRWGHRLFESDTDLDFLLELPRDIGIDEKDWKYTLGQLLHQSDMLAPAESTAWYGTDDYAELHEEVIVPYVRHKLDTDGLGEKLLERSRRSGPFLYTYYQTIVLAAVMMRAGAKIKPEHLLYLRRAARAIEIESVQAQFLSALDHYQPGVPRSFEDDWSVDPSKHAVSLPANSASVAASHVAIPRRTLDIRSSLVNNASCSTAIG